MAITGSVFAAMGLLSACKNNAPSPIDISAGLVPKNSSSYTVIARTNREDVWNGTTVAVVLEHDRHKYYARCNNIKGPSDPSNKGYLHCDLHVGMTVECQFFPNRHVTGYDLICGNRRDAKGNLDTYGENELLFIDKEEN